MYLSVRNSAFRTYFSVQNNPLDLCMRAVNSKRVICSRKTSSYNLELNPLINLELSAKGGVEAV